MEKNPSLINFLKKDANLETVRPAQKKDVEMVKTETMIQAPDVDIKIAMTTTKEESNNQDEKRKSFAKDPNFLGQLIGKVCDLSGY